MAHTGRGPWRTGREEVGDASKDLHAQMRGWSQSDFGLASCSLRTRAGIMLRPKTEAKRSGTTPAHSWPRAVMTSVAATPCRRTSALRPPTPSQIEIVKKMMDPMDARCEQYTRALTELVNQIKSN